MALNLREVILVFIDSKFCDYHVVGIVGEVLLISLSYVDNTTTMYTNDMSFWYLLVVDVFHAIVVYCKPFDVTK